MIKCCTVCAGRVFYFCLLAASLQTKHGATVKNALNLSRFYGLTNCPIPPKLFEFDRRHVCLAKEKKLMIFETLTFDFRRLIFDFKQHFISRV